MKLTIEQTKTGFKAGSFQCNTVHELASYVRGYFTPCNTQKTTSLTDSTPAPSKKSYRKN